MDIISEIPLVLHEKHIDALLAEMGWLQQVWEHRLQEDAGFESDDITEIAELPDPDPDAAYTQLIIDRSYGPTERLLLILCFTQVFKPELTENALALIPQEHGNYNSRVGGVREKISGRFLPSMQTALFLLAGNNDLLRAQYHLAVTARHPLFSDGIIKLTQPSPLNTSSSAQLLHLDKSYFYYFLNGKKVRLDETENFPAELLQTTKTMDDLVLAEATLNQLQIVTNYARHYRQMYEATSGQMQGFVTMFHGPPGTGKTMAASVIGKELGLDVYAVNLSRVISKYIGETEKNLELVFDRLANKECILFFDEADALFGKRAEVNEANDRYANQEVAYLLQKIDKCSCLVILATNFRQNFDFAFTRRILTFIRIDWPDVHERLLLWQKALPLPFTYTPATLPETLAHKFSLTGANIHNIVKLACYKAMAAQQYEITLPLLEPFIKVEYTKEKRSYADPLNWPIYNMS